MRHAKRYFEASVEACGILGVRGIMLTGHADQLPALPPTVRHAPSAPFQELFPLCAAVVHHGGIGTAAKAFAAAAPQLILPFAFDQPDNGERVKRLGAGDWLKPRKITGPNVAAALARIMTPHVRARCRELALKIQQDDAIDNASRWIEELATRGARIQRAAT
jgi:UDP:flavonoid glycosyltransferase YjiC (YdhE family)